LPDLLTRCGREHLDDLGGRRFDPLAADEQLVVFGLVGRVHALCHERHTTQIPAKREPVPVRRLMTAEGPAPDCSPGTPSGPALRSSTTPIVVGSGESRQPGRRCSPPTPARRTPTPRTTTIRSRFSADARVC